MAERDLVQAPILALGGRLARYHVFALESSDSDPREALAELPAFFASLDCPWLLGVGQPLALALDVPIPGLRTFPALSGPGVSVPSTQGALLCALFGGDRGEIFHRSRRLLEAVGDAFVLDDLVDTFVYRDSRDLTGYEDGTENPTGEDAVAAAIVSGADSERDGGSFVAVQRWVHDLDAFEAMRPGERDHVVGRRLSDNEEIDDAPAYSHVKRAAQESYEPEAFMVRRSMPFVQEDQEGLLFVAFGESLDRYERVLRRMSGLDDGIVDGLFRFSHPVSGGYYFCPPQRDGAPRLDLLRI